MALHPVIRLQTPSVMWKVLGDLAPTPSIPSHHPSSFQVTASLDLGLFCPNLANTYTLFWIQPFSSFSLRTGTMLPSSSHSQGTFILFGGADTQQWLGELSLLSLLTL